ncbi:MAG: methyltransferase domain-containing protein [bacterium]|nr:methyltransferase domain-containing protein [bacterium]
MKAETYYRDHWLDIDPDRIEVYEEMFRWRPEMAPLLAPAEISEGQTVVDYGCGPGMLSLELAQRVGPSGHVHAVDINDLFLERAELHADGEALRERIGFHRIEEDRLPLEDSSVDRVICKNVLEYVDDPEETLRDFRRVLRPGGRVHAIDSDWGMLVVEPIEPERLARIFGAASMAYKTPLIGRKLFGCMRSAGFDDVKVKVLVGPDTKGRAAAIPLNMAKYARESGQIPESEIDQFAQDIKDAVEAGTYMLVLPQFLVTAIAPESS